MKRTIHVRITKGERQFVAECLDLPVATQAATLDELVFNIRPGDRAPRRGGFHRPPALGRPPAARRGLHPRSLAAPLRPGDGGLMRVIRSEEHTSELQSLRHLVCRLLLEKK